MSSMVARLLLVAVSLFAIPLCCLAQKHNDFTKASTSYSRKYQTEESRFGGQKSRMQDTALGKKSYYDSQKSSALGGKESYWSNKEAMYNSSNLAPDASKNFSAPEFKGDLGKWYRSGTKANFVNGDRNLSKVYKGRIDMNKRNVEYQAFIDKYYGNLVDRSMEDFNKFYSRASTEDSTYVKRAGAQLSGEDEDGFFDFLTSDTKIKRKAVKFTGVERNMNTANMQKKQTPPVDTMPSTGMQKPPPVMPSAPQVKPQPNQMKTSSSNEAKEVIIDNEQAKKYHFLKAPDQYRSKATIKVQVKE